MAVPDVPRAALDLHTQLVQYHGTPAQKANFVKKAINAISTSIQVLPTPLALGLPLHRTIHILITSFFRSELK
jgi:hypothetical protein